MSRFQWLKRSGRLMVWDIAGERCYDDCVDYPDPDAVIELASDGYTVRTKHIRAKTPTLQEAVRVAEQD